MADTPSARVTWSAAGLIWSLLGLASLGVIPPARGQQDGSATGSPPGVEQPPGDQASPGGGPASANPYRGQPEALDEGERIYRSRCIGCHFRAGGRGPNIFRTTLGEAEFVDAVTNGRKNGMPAWGSVLSADEIRKVHAFVMSRDRL